MAMTTRVNINVCVLTMRATTMLFSTVAMDRTSKHVALFRYGSLEWTPEFAVLSPQYWQDVCHMFFLFSFDTAPNEVVCYYKIRRKDGPGVPGTPDGS